MSAKRTNRGSVTAAELMAELEADEDYQAQIKQQDAARDRQVAEWRRAEAPLVKELRASGFEVESAWDLVNTSTPYPEALPILLNHLKRRYPDRVREGIARALAVQDAAFAAEVLIELYRQEKAGTDAKDGLAVAIGGAADDAVVDDVIALAKDPANGTNRVLMLDALGRSKAPQARAALAAIAQDPAIGEEARRLLKERRSKR